MFDPRKGVLRDLVEALIIATDKGLLTPEEATTMLKNAIISFTNSFSK